MKTEIDDFDKSSDNLFLKTDIGKFFVKSLIVVAMIFGGMYFLIPDARVFKGLETDQNKYIALTLIQNPRILWKMSETDESKGNLPNAIRDMEVAIGLLEMHGARLEVLQTYQNRLQALENKKTNAK
ncbi:MAG: hypothetical protein WCO72_14270 [Betaproteobacteria bacterium]|jgi:hypothetical protein|nr:hypothetical protein [Polynucleobacter sp.]NBY65113.1 hypothetical protein [Betaproteobacteria bacterium]